MKIAILGNGKMGRRITQLAEKKGHIVLVKSDSRTPANNLDLREVDVAIDFSTPLTAQKNVMHALNSNVPIISGTTDWFDRIPETIRHCKKRKGAFLYSPNFSLGMNIFFQLNKKLAELMKKKEYIREIHEIHHAQKLDAPSGTAKILADDIRGVLKDETSISYERIEETIGTHHVKYISKEDEIEMKHTAKNRDGFALGAILAAEWIIGKQGVFSFQDVLKI